ncbi:MAG TPA: hypothetical protein VHZ74_02210 [Bryobacteraceae bacterium]|nr:hypothetical protein [Bryobacteraceae bacterium]
MVYRAGLLTTSALLVASGAFGQISFPGQYPPGQYPPGQYPPGQGRYPQGGSSSPFPGRGKKTTEQQDNQARGVTVVGILRRISDADLVVDSDDKRVVTVALASTTKYYKATGGTAKTTDLQPGDHVSIDATQDDSGYYHARSVSQIKQGTEAERAAASEPVDVSPIGDGGNGGGAAGDDDRPRLRRSPSPDDKAPTASQNTTSQNTTPASAPTPTTPPITRSDSSQPVRTADRDQPEAAPAPDPSDPGPPRLRRGAPAKRASTSSDEAPSIAQNNPPPAPRPTIHADEVNGVTLTPQPPKIEEGAAQTRRAATATQTAKSGDPVIDKAREAASSFSETLPNYIVKQFTTRYQTEAARGGQTSWRAIDTVSADVVSEGAKETYKNVLVNGKTPKEDVEKSGAWSTGEFSSLLLDILSPETDADFHNRRSTTIVNRGAYRYDYSVEQVNSHWHVYAAAESYRPEYTGTIWIDKETSRVLRIELSGRNMPKAFPLDTVESAVDYDFVLIGDGKFLLPIHSESLSCERGTSICSRNVIDFRNYRKFGADTSITFEPASEK